jgi:predicted Zn-dependent protease
VSKLLDKIVGFLKKDVGDIFSAETLQDIGKLANTDVSDLMSDAKASKLLSEIEKNPEKVENYIQLAELYRYKNKIDKAVDVYLGMAQRELDAKRLDLAASYVQMGLNVAPDNGILNKFSADIDIRRGKFSDAADKYRAAVNYYIKKNDRMTAIYLLHTIKEMNKATVRDLLNLSSILIRENMTDEAEKILMSIRESHKKGEISNVRDLEACLLMLYSMRKDDDVILGELIEARIEMGQYESVMVLLKKLIAKDPENVNFLKRQAFVYKQMNDINNCVKIFKVIANIYAKQNNLIYRNIYYHKVLKYAPDDVEALSVLRMDDQIREKLDSKIENTDSKIKIFDRL